MSPGQAQSSFAPSGVANPSVSGQHRNAYCIFKLRVSTSNPDRFDIEHRRGHIHANDAFERCPDQATNGMLSDDSLGGAQQFDDFYAVVCRCRLAVSKEMAP